MFIFVLEALLVSSYDVPQMVILKNVEHSRCTLQGGCQASKVAAEIPQVKHEKLGCVN